MSKLFSVNETPIHCGLKVSRTESPDYLSVSMTFDGEETLTRALNRENVQRMVESLQAWLDKK